MSSSIDINSIKDWLNFLKRMPAPEGYHNRGEFLEKYGWGFVIGPQTFEGKRGKQHACYENSAKMVFDNDKLIYVEGYITLMSIPIEHAWVAKKNDVTHVIDPTLTKPDFEVEYFGIPFKTDYVRKTSLRTGVWGIISHTNMDLFKKGKALSKVIYGAGTMIRVNNPFICIVQEEVSTPQGWSVVTEAGDKCFVTFTKKTKAMRGDRIYVTPSKVDGDVVKSLYDAKLEPRNF